MELTDRPSAVWRYYLYRATGHVGFQYPIYILFLQANGLTFTAIGAIASIQSLVVIAGEVPTGYIGDRIGRRNSLVIASILFLVSGASYLVATDFIGFTFTFVALSFGQTFVSGSGNAWLYDTLDEHGLEDEFTHINGRAGAISSGTQTIAMVTGGVLYVIDPYYPFIAAVVLNSLNVVSALSLPKNTLYADRTAETGSSTSTTEADSSSEEGDADGEGNETDDGDERLSVLEALPVIREQLSQPALRSFIVYMALFGGALMTADIYVQPIAQEALRTSLGPLLDEWGVPEAATLGVLYAAFTGVSAIASDYAGDIEDRFGVRRVLLLVPVGMAVIYLLPVIAPLLAFPMFFVMRGGFSVVFPISGRYLNDRIESVGRATVLSVVAMLRAVAGVPFRVGSGVVADYASPLVAVAALGVVFLVGAAALLLWVPPIRTGTDTAAAAD